LFNWPVDFEKPDASHEDILDSTRYIDSEDEGYVGGFKDASIHAMLGAMESNFQAWVKGFVPNAAGSVAVEEHIMQSFLAMDPDVALGVARMIFLGDEREALDVVPTSCTIVQARHDFAAPPVVAEYMQGRMASAGTGVTVEIVESAGHFPQLVASARVADILDGVLLPLHDKGAYDAVGAPVHPASDVEVDGGAIDVMT
jgi:pimeloyl-ACP methyl ester carboxylesterase